MTLPSVSHSTVAATAAGANTTALSPTAHDRVAPRAAAGRTSVVVEDVVELVAPLDAVAWAIASGPWASVSPLLGVRHVLRPGGRSRPDRLLRCCEIGTGRLDVAYGRRAVSEHLAVPVQGCDVVLGLAAESLVGRDQRVLGLGEIRFAPSPLGPRPPPPGPGSHSACSKCYAHRRRPRPQR